MFSSYQWLYIVATRYMTKERSLKYFPIASLARIYITPLTNEGNQHVGGGMGQGPVKPVAMLNKKNHLLFIQKQ